MKSLKTLFGLLTAVLILASCGDKEKVEKEPELIYVGPWTRGWPSLGHDGEPYESITEVWPDYPTGNDDFYFEEE